MEAKGSVKNMLSMDIQLKDQLNALFAKFLKRQIINLVLASFCTAGVICVLIFFLLRPNKVDSMVFNAIQKERMMIRIERERVGMEKDSLRILMDNWNKLHK